MFWWEICGDERDLVVSGNAVYGGGGPRAVVVVVVVTVELRCADARRAGRVV